MESKEKYLIIDHNIFITAKTILRKHAQNPSFPDLFELLESDFLFFTLCKKYQPDFEEVIPLEKTKFIENYEKEFGENFEDGLLFLAQDFYNTANLDIYTYFQRDPDKDNDLKLLGFVFYVKYIKEVPFVFLHRENKIRFVCDKVNLNDCCLLHILDCFTKNGFNEFSILKKNLENSSIPNPKWVKEVNFKDCDIFFR
ncbi:hypothetical protein GWK41_05640 [Persephonella atlantica]|uniref:PIN domain-containing protein n=1 Tax=Persephonella atlantica TaxID=2699429 RepID=A0ABS1GI04_9AQUI|nr:hypothetical protein [Persephonella atlantica]MBK3332542.1 hypothetical protein [Persephonella atlantica]